MGDEMIELSDLRKGYLKTLFDGISDADLIQELVRRERFGQVGASVVVEDEMMEMPHYAEHMKGALAGMIARELAKETERGYTITERPNPNNSYRIRSQTERIADVIFLRAKETQCKAES